MIKTELNIKENWALQKKVRIDFLKCPIQSSRFKPLKELIAKEKWCILRS